MVLHFLLHLFFISSCNAMNNNKYSEADQALIARMPVIMQEIYFGKWNDIKGPGDRLLTIMRDQNFLETLAWNNIFNEHRQKPEADWEKIEITAAAIKRELPSVIREQTYRVLTAQITYALSPATIVSLADDMCKVLIYGKKPTTPHHNVKSERAALTNIAAQFSPDFASGFKRCLAHCWFNHGQHAKRLQKACQIFTATAYSAQQNETEQIIISHNVSRNDDFIYRKF